jgi:hypothetical protein
MFLSKREENDWCLWSVILYLIKSNKQSTYHLLFWLLINFLIRVLSTGCPESHLTKVFSYIFAISFNFINNFFFNYR